MIGTVALLAALFFSYIVVGAVCAVKGMEFGAEEALRDAPIVTVGWQEMMEDRNRALNERDSALQLRLELQQRYDDLKRNAELLSDELMMHQLTPCSIYAEQR